MADQYFSQRYQRQILLPGIGTEGQRLLQQAKVLVIGAGGLGCPALQYLAAAGVGTIGIIDGDTVDVTNLHRQILYTNDDIEKPKAATAKEKLEKQNPGCNIIAYSNFIDKNNAWDLIEAYDIILDGSDNFATRYLVNDVCVLQHKPLVYGGLYRFEGQVAVFNYTDSNGVVSAQYRDLFPNAPEPGSVPNCADAGVMGVLPGIIGSMQANEIIKLITGIGKPLANKILTFNSLTNQTLEIELFPTKSGLEAVPKSREAIENYEYDFDCTCTNNTDVQEIDAARFEILRKQKKITIIDVREEGEKPAVTAFDHLQIPLSKITGGADFIKTTNDIVFFCHAGIRSRTAAEFVLTKFHLPQNVYNLKNGIIEWLTIYGQD